MKQPLRVALLIASALLMIFGAVVDAFIGVPDLHGDLVEIGVRPTVLGGTVGHLYFGVIAMFGFAMMVSAAAVQAIRGIAPPRMPLAIVATVYIAFGVVAFLRNHSPHHFGSVAMGVLLATALAVPDAKRSLT